MECLEKLTNKDKMTKKQLLESLEEFNDDDHLKIGELLVSYTPKIEVICGGRQQYMASYCCLHPNHEGQCYCAISIKKIFNQ